jgi:uncharacterized protein YfaS (alpha-2-macroglobulin family)
VVGGAVAFDASEVPSREIGMHNADIDPEERYADLGMDFPAVIVGNSIRLASEVESGDALG